MNAEELKMAISPVVLRDEVTRLQAKEQLWYQDVEEREELAKLQLETLDALGAEIKRLNEQVKTLQGYLRPHYEVGDSVDWIDIADEGSLRVEVRALRAWRSVAVKLAERLRETTEAFATDVYVESALADFDAMKGETDER